MSYGKYGMCKWVAALCWVEGEEVDGTGRATAHFKPSTGGTLKEVVHFDPLTSWFMGNLLATACFEVILFHQHFGRKVELLCLSREQSIFYAYQAHLDDTLARIESINHM